MERTLVFIKPGAVNQRFIGRVISRFEDRGLKILAMKMLTFTSQLVDEHYQEHIEKPFYASLKEYTMSGPVVVMILEAEKVISIVRDMAGPTDSAIAPPGTIRGDLSHIKPDNVIHASDCPKSAEREINIFFKENI
jgi:nucleoside-diphosphate kinase